MTSHQPTVMPPWGRGATFGLGLIALLAGQIATFFVLVGNYGSDPAKLASIGEDGVAVVLTIVVSTPIQVALLALFAHRGGSASAYLGLIWPRRSDVVFGVAAIVAFIIIGNTVSWLLGSDIVTPFQTGIYRTASTAGWLPLLWLAVVVVGPIGEETLYRGFLFRGWLRSPRDAWPVIVITALLWAIMHVQYDLFVMSQIFVSGLLLGWLRWCSGSTILTILLHCLVNFEGMLETFIALHD